MIPSQIMYIKHGILLIRYDAQYNKIIYSILVFWILQNNKNQLDTIYSTHQLYEVAILEKC